MMGGGIYPPFEKLGLIKPVPPKPAVNPPLTAMSGFQARFAVGVRDAAKRRKT